ncbi:Leucine-rich repeat [Dillenia turbinata]|uniref:Leucine-rich repeat n=1 Tax=Dillenia turbinata TaxID=194707 RepID=A0AAN8VRU6_9MAGN
MPAILRNILLSSSSSNIFSFTLLLAINSLFFFSSGLSLEEQGQALLTWKNCLNSSTDVLSSWNSADSSPCRWFGIVCNSNGEVEEINLRSRDLQGPLPSNFQSLESLKSLVLSSTNLTGTIPKEFGEYHELVHIDISDNSISGEIPAEICMLMKLQTLSLNTNSITGGIPSDIGNLSSLVYLTIYDNQLSGEIPKSIGKLSKLEVFRAGGNQNLKEIDNNNISGEIPSLIGKLTGLTLFFAWQNRLTGNIPAGISDCQNLQALDISYNNLTGPIPRQIFGLQNLTKLLLLSNELSDFIPPDIGNCTNLYRFRVNYNRLAGSVPPEVGKLKSLNFLDLSNNHFEGGIPPSISGCENLDDLAGNRALYISNGVLTPADHVGPTVRSKSTMKLTMSVLVSASAVLVLLTVYILVRARLGEASALEDNNWAMTLYQKMELSIDDVVKNLTSANVIGTGSSGVVYRVGITNGQTLAVKKMWSSEEYGAFMSEIRTLGSIRHRNISKNDPVDILDQKLRGRADPQMHEMLQTLAVSFLCISTRADERPTMKDVVAMLREIRHVDSTRTEDDLKGCLSCDPSPPTRARTVDLQGSSNCSFAFSDDSV